MSEEAPTLSRLTREDVDACRFPVWHPLLRHCALKCAQMRLPDEFVSFLLADKVVLPTECDAMEGRTFADADLERESDSEGSGWGEGGGDDTGEAGEAAEADVSFPTVTAFIRDSVAELGGAVFPKLDWSGPVDAQWMTGTLRCTTAADVYLLLKSSDRIAADLTLAYQHCCDAEGGAPPASQCTLVLKEWREMEHAHEFRCFVVRNVLVAASQRHTATHFEHLASQRSAIAEELRDFFLRDVCERLPLPSFAMDVYIERFASGARPRVYVLDIAPLAEHGLEPLLFSWEELARLAATGHGGVPPPPEVRVVLSPPAMGPASSMYFGLPKDLLDVAHEGGLASVVNRLREERAAQERAGSDSED